MRFGLDWRRRTIAMAIVAAGAVLVSASPAMAVDPGPNDGRYLLVNETTSYNCLFNKPDHTSQLWHCSTGYNDQLWDVTSFVVSWYTMRDVSTGLCLSSNSKTVGAALTSQTCSINDGQVSAQDEWHWGKITNAAGNLAWQIRNNYSGLCLVVKGGGTGVVATQYNCEGYTDQSWGISTV